MRFAASEFDTHALAVVPSTRVTTMKGKALQHGNHMFLAQSASVVGDVTVGELSGVYYGAVVRGKPAALTSSCKV